MRRGLFEDFCNEYVKELSRLRMEHRARLSGARDSRAGAAEAIRGLLDSSFVLCSLLLTTEALNVRRCAMGRRSTRRE
jgi:hypothetical protein